MSTQTTRPVTDSDTAYALDLFASLSSTDMDLSSRPLVVYRNNRAALLNEHIVKCIF